LGADPKGSRIVKPPKFEYHAPATLDEAVAALGRYGGDAQGLAGGPSLMPPPDFRLGRAARRGALHTAPPRPWLPRASGEGRPPREAAPGEVGVAAGVGAAAAAPGGGDSLGRPPADPYAGHDRRLDRPCRSVGRVPGGAGRARGRGGGARREG